MHVQLGRRSREIAGEVGASERLVIVEGLQHRAENVLLGFGCLVGARGGIGVSR